MPESQRKTLLLVEDEAILAMNEKMQLEKYGYAVKTANTGEQAVEAIQSDAEIDLVLMDINLGDGIDGTQAAQMILKDHDIPIVFVSSHSEREVVEKTERITSYGYVVKNSSITVLDASIKMAFRLFEANQAMKTSSKKDHEIAQLLVNIMDNFPGLIFWKDEESIYRGCSRAFALSAGLESADDIIGKSDYQLAWNRYEAADYRKDDRIVLDMGIPKMHILETQHTSSGSTIWLDTSKIPLYDGDGCINGILGVSLDVTGIRKREEALHDSEATYRSILEASPDAIIITDLESRILIASLIATKILHRPENELTGHTLSEYLIPEDRDRAVNDISLMLQGVSGGIWEYHAIQENGSIIDIEVNAEFVRDMQGQPTKIIFIVRDVCSRNRIVNRYKKLFELLPVGMAMINHKTGAFLDANRSILRATGYSKEEFLKLSFWDITPKEYQAQEDMQFNELNETNIFETNEKEYIRKDGTRYPIAISGAKFTDENGIDVVWGIIEDITERKRSEQRIISLLAEKDLLLKEVHHRIKNNMNTISSLLSLQASSISEPTAVKALQDAGNRVQSMSVLYDQLYRSADFTELSVKQYLSALVDDVLQNFPNRGMVRVEKDLQDFNLEAKRLQPLGNIINELLTNIMKYAFKGRDSGLIVVSATNCGGHITVAVKDDGIGMPETAAFDSSAGFGLQLVQALSQQLHGTIRIERDNGTRVVLDFDA